MGEFRYIPPDEVAERHRARTPRTPLRQRAEPTSTQRNVKAVLSLGDVRYFSYRGANYRVPPVPFLAGQRVLDAHIRTVSCAKQVAMGNNDLSDEFYSEMKLLAKLLWKHIRPSGKVNRFLWRCGLLRNPFRNASEKEIQQVTDFFLQGRMTSSVQLMSEAEMSG